MILLRCCQENKLCAYRMECAVHFRSLFGTIQAAHFLPLFLQNEQVDQMRFLRPLEWWQRQFSCDISSCSTQDDNKWRCEWNDNGFVWLFISLFCKLAFDLRNRRSMSLTHSNNRWSASKINWVFVCFRVAWIWYISRSFDWASRRIHHSERLQEFVYHSGEKSNLQSYNVDHLVKCQSFNANALVVDTIFHFHLLASLIWMFICCTNLQTLSHIIPFHYVFQHI